MELRLYSFSKKHNSTKQLLNDAAPVATFTDFDLKQNTDLDNPTFLIDDTFRDVNYAYLVDIGRFYFINKYRLGNRYIYEIECEVDALATYKTYILAYTAFVERCADPSYYNVMFNDPLVSVKSEIDNWDMTDTPISDFSSSNGCYVLRVVGGDADGVSTFVTDNLADFAPLFDVQTYLDSDTSWFEKWGNLVFDPWDYIISFSWSPLKLSFYQDNGAALSYIWVKWVNTRARAYKLPNNKIGEVNVLNIAAPASLYADFRHNNPNFTRYKMFVPAVGLLDLDNNEARHGIEVHYAIALDTGSATIDLISSSDLVVIAHYNAELYTSLQGATDRTNIGQIVSEAAGSLSAWISGDPIGGVAGTISAIGNAFKPTPQMIGSSGGIGIRTNTSIKFISEIFGSGQIPTAVAGRPCYKNLLLSNLTGFVQCAGASLELPANEAVKIKINAFLNEGFYIE